MARQVNYGTKARQQLVRGALKLAHVVGVTYGPRGRTCILDRMAGLLATRDGVTVAREVTLANPVENQGAAILKTACTKVNEEVGDGTTTTAVLAAEILHLGNQLLCAGFDARKLCQGIQEAARAAEEALLKLSLPIESQEHIARIATLAANGDTEVAEALSEAAMAVGNNGTIIIEDGQGTDVRIELREGLELDRGPINVASLGTGTERVMDGPLVAVVEDNLSALEDIREMLEASSQWAPRELLLFALSVGGEAQITLLLNDAKGVVKSTAIRCPGYGHLRTEYLKDIAALTGATYVTRATGMSPQQWDAQWFGSLRTATIKGQKTVLIPYQESGAPLQQRVLELKGEAEKCTSDFDRDNLQKRIAMLSGSLALLKVGGVTEAARKERRARVEDALAAVRAALQGGVVPGGGSAFLQVSLLLTPPAVCDPTVGKGWELLASALSHPLHVLIQNAGGQSELAIERLLETWAGADNDIWLGWDVVQGGIRDFAQDPILLDPTKVEVAVLRAAVSVATTLLNIGVSVTRS